MVLGLIGAFLGLPAALCSGMCAAGMQAAANMKVNEAGEMVSESTGGGMGSLFLVLGLVSVVLAIIGSIKVLRKPKVGGGLLMAAFALAAVTSITMNMLSILVTVLLLIAGILGIASKPADAAAAAPPAQPAV
jgi:hypothetical protein